MIRAIQARHVTWDRHISTILLQSFLRMVLSKRHKKQLIGIQIHQRHVHVTAITKTWRRYAAHLHVDFMIVDCLVIQSIIRRHLARETVNQLRWKVHTHSARTIQFIMRTNMMVQRHARVSLALLHSHSATILQSIMRTYMIVQQQARASLALLH